MSIDDEKTKHLIGDTIRLLDSHPTINEISLTIQLSDREVHIIINQKEREGDGAIQ